MAWDDVMFVVVVCVRAYRQDDRSRRNALSRTTCGGVDAAAAGCCRCVARALGRGHGGHRRATLALRRWLAVHRGPVLLQRHAQDGLGVQHHHDGGGQPRGEPVAAVRVGGDHLARDVVGDADARVP